ncbi:MAG: malonyl-CoA synthase [Paracoccaceae bacterium]|nr:malonyl-CoA synthase [Paracoccaceae bacterium]
MTNHLFDTLFAGRAESDTPFLICEGCETLSYRDFFGMAAQMAHGLVALGVEPGDRLVVQAAKSAELVALYVASVAAGAVFLPLNTAYKDDEVGYFVEDAEPRLLVVDDSAAARLRPIAEGVAARLLTLNADGSGTLARAAEDKREVFQPVPRAPDDLAALLYTSGTTGRSKGAMLTHENLASNALALTDLWAITDRDVLIHALPIFHTHGLFVALGTAMAAGAAVRFFESFDLDAILDALPDATLMMGVPTFYTRLLGSPRLTRERCADMRLFISGSAPLLAETHRAFAERTGHAILERYGMTETGMNTSNPYDGTRRAGTVGRPLPGVDIRLTDPETGAEVAPGGVGMVEVRGPNVFNGYWRMPDKTAEEMRADGFFVTGDLGRLSDDGYLSIVGRAKDLIITGGLNVYPKEVEDVLNAAPGVAESAVFGVPDADFGEAVVAAVVPAPGSEVDAGALAAAVGEKLARFKHPRRYEIVDALPRNAMGKVQKAVLRERFSSR